jgi:5'(3')-deoxyribonucleotidase
MKLQEVRLNQDPEEEISYVIFCDIDGVLADFKSQMTKVFHSMNNDNTQEYSDEQYAKDPKFRSQMWKLITAYQKKHGQILWRHLELMPDAMQLWNYIKNKNPQILSATGNETYGAPEQKRAWITEHFGSSIRINLVKSAPDKAEYAAPNHILIDDQLRAIQPFQAAGGIGIHHTGAANTIVQLKKLGI